jgi:hypothetical protein
MVSTDTGKLLDATRLENAFIRVAEATVLSDGRMRAVYGGKRLFVWTQGEAAAPLPIPFANQMTAAISPDGGFLLVANDLRVAWTCTRGGKCWQGPPVKGIVAILYELPAGREVWTLRSNADEPSPKAPLPEISPDGAYALVGLPSSFQVQRFAVVSMKDGTIVQTMPAPGDHYNFGFARDGDVVWTHDHGVTAIYQTRHDVR